MIYEMRTYQVQAGKAAEFLNIYGANGLGIITRYAKLVGCWTKEFWRPQLRGLPVGLQRLYPSH